MGVYTARPVSKGDRIYYGDVVVQVEDYAENNRLRHMYNGIQEETPESWLLDAYYWNSPMTMALHEARDVLSIVPGLGMLANSHTGLVNAELVAPIQSTTLH